MEGEEPAQSYDEQNISIQDNVATASTTLEEDPQARLEIEEPRPAVASFFYLCWQKTIDIVFGLLGLLLLFVLLPLLTVLIYLDSPGPIFYHQERVGYRGQKFFMHKFRSMRLGAEQAGYPVWGAAGDRRVTHIGRFLRATHLDELPQVINILRGEMSLIGPRPERPEYVAELEKTSPLYRYRLDTKPGLTGWAQVNYGYGNSYRDDLIKLQYDLYYIERRSCTFDLLIILKTFVEVLRSRGDK